MAHGLKAALCWISLAYEYINLLIASEVWEKFHTPTQPTQTIEPVFILKSYSAGSDVGPPFQRAFLGLTEPSSTAVHMELFFTSPYKVLT